MKQQAQLRYHQIQQQQQRFHDNNSGAVRTLGLPNSAWPTLQQAQNPRNGSNMTALFLGNQLAAGKRECAGTGVFLPRQQVGAKTETRRKQPQGRFTLFAGLPIITYLTILIICLLGQVDRVYACVFLIACGRSHHERTLYSGRKKKKAENVTDVFVININKYLTLFFFHLIYLLQFVRRFYFQRG